MTTHYVEFEDESKPRDDRVYDAATMLDRVAAFFREDDYNETDWHERCDESWERAIEEADDAA